MGAFSGLKYAYGAVRLVLSHYRIRLKRETAHGVTRTTRVGACGELLPKSRLSIRNSRFYNQVVSSIPASMDAFCSDSCYSPTLPSDPLKNW